MTAIKCFDGVESARDVQEELVARLSLPVAFHFFAPTKHPEGEVLIR